MPGPISGTEGMKRLAETVGAQPWTDGIPLGRLSSRLASFVTGARVPVDGGLTLSGSGLVDRALREVGPNAAD